MSIFLIGRPTRIITAFFMILFLLLFITTIVIYTLGLSESPIINDSMREFFVMNPLGWVIIMFLGLTALTFTILMLLFWMYDTKYKDLRYKMAFFLYHSKVKRNDKIPLQYLARVGVCTVHEIAKTLEGMIAKNELKGMVDRERGIYIHKGLVRSKIRFLMALPSARVSGLQAIKKQALMPHNWGDGQEDTEELEEFEIEELPSARELIRKKDRNKIKCPHCGRMNIKEHQFCTFCGEVI